MTYLIKPHAVKNVAWAYWDDIFTVDELNILQALADATKKEALVGNCTRIDNSLRRSTTDWLSFTEDNMWVYEKLGYVVSQVNASCFNFDLTCFGEPLQLTKYDSSNNGGYAWHRDVGDRGPCRKLSLVLQLSDPCEYEGGQLEIEYLPDTIQIPKKRGYIAIK